MTLDNRSVPPGMIGDGWVSAFIDPVVKLWRHDRPHLTVFAIANLIFGQAGLFIALLFFIQNGITFGPFWDETVSSGALYTFAIALTASVLASIVFEFVDGQYKNQKIPLWKHKLWWSLVAAMLIVSQAALVGGLLSSSEANSRQAVSVKEITADTALAGGEAQEQKSTQVVSTATAVASRPNIRSWLQVVLWIISMWVALQLFCISRLPFIQDSHARDRTETVAALTEGAESKTETDFGEKL